MFKFYDAYVFFLLKDLEFKFQPGQKHHNYTRALLARYTNTRLWTTGKLDDLMDGPIWQYGDWCLVKRNSWTRTSDFGGVFTSEDLIHNPEPASQYTGSLIDVIHMAAEMVRRKLQALKL